MGKVGEKSPFDDAWRRDTLVALAAHPYSAHIALELALVARRHDAATLWWPASLRNLAWDIDAARERT